MKKVITGWIGKNDDISKLLEFDDFLIVNRVIQRVKKDRMYWGVNYPPRKIRITIEEL